MDVVNKETYFWKTNQNLKSDIIRKVLVESRNCFKNSMIGSHQNVGKQARNRCLFSFPPTVAGAPLKPCSEKEPVSVRKTD